MQRSAIGIAAFLLSCYLLVLIGATYIGQGKLQNAVEEQLLLELNNKAHALGYFFTESREELVEFGLEPGMDAYLSNLSLGMSMDLGLGASLLNLPKRMRRFMQEERVGDQPIFHRIVLYDTQGQVLIDSMESPSSALPLPEVDLVSGENSVILAYDLGGAPVTYAIDLVEYKGQPAGFLLGQLNIVPAFRRLVSWDSEASLSSIQLYSRDIENWVHRTDHHFESGLVESLSNLVRLEQPTLRLDEEHLGIKSAIPGTQFVLVGVFERTLLSNALTSPWYVAALGFLAVPVLGIVAYLVRLNSKNLVLETRFTESRKQEEALGVQNQRLEAEIVKCLEYEEKLAYRANHDILTDLPNRRLGMDRLSQAIKRAKREGKLVLFMFIDLDHFKQVNDTLGHIAGDELLLQASERIEQVLRGSDTVARLGGDEFIPLAEETGFIDEIGDWVLRRACRDAARWQEIRPLRLAVNISPKQFIRRECLLEGVMTALQESGLPASRLELEITEGVLITNRRLVGQILAEFESWGVRLSIDDFGTGYSALNYLQKFPFCTLKIDRSFLKDVLVNTGTEALIKAIVAMAHAMNLEVVGEGVETEGQAEFLKQQNCELVQGYLYSKPLNPAGIDLLLEQDARPKLYRAEGLS